MSNFILIIAATMILPIKDNLNGHQLIQEELAMQSKINKEILKISQKIKRISYGHSKEYIRKISKYIYKSSEKYNINEDILISIIQKESSFRQNIRSRTNDVSLVQINPRWWRKEFKRLKRSPLNEEKLKKDTKYAIDRMAEILSILKDRHKDDPHWYANYHSTTKKLKNRYLASIQKIKYKIKNM